MPRTQLTIRTPAEALAAADAGIDALAVNFIRGNSRFLEPADAWKIVSALPPLISSVGIFANASLDTFSDIEEICPTVYTLLAGNEDESLVRECGPGIIKTVRYTAPMTDATSLAELERQLARWDRLEEVDAVLLELPPALAPDHYPALAHLTAPLTKPLFLGGHLTPASLPATLAIFHPYALDLTEAAATSPHPLDLAKLNALCRALA